MRIVHVTPHLPPDQAANALLPFQLGEWAASRGDAVEYVAHPPRAGRSTATLPGPVTWIPRTERTLLQRWFRTGSISRIGVTRAVQISYDLPRTEPVELRGWGSNPRPAD